MISPQSRQAAVANRPPHLTPREKEILALIAEGDSNQQVADSLGISRRTVDTCLLYLYRKLGISSRMQAAVYARQAELMVRKEECIAS